MATAGDHADAGAKVLFCRRLGDSWRDVADLLGVEPYERRTFKAGDEAREVWEWAESRRRLPDLRAALPGVGRADLVELVRLDDLAPSAPAPRRYAPTRAALDGAGTVPPQRRSIVDDVFVPRMAEVIEQPAVIAVVADAGMGKSVLLGQLYDNAAEREDLGVVLLSCAALVGGRPADVPELDRAAGQATGCGDSLLTALAGLRDAYGRVVLLIDTVDLILDSSTVPVLSQFLRRVVDAGVAVVCTCRQFEFETFLQGVDGRAPLLAGLLRSVRLKPLDRAEVRWFAREFLRHGPAADDPDAFVDRLLYLGARRSAVLEICSNPLLLSLVCELFAPAGEPPEDLTVSRLYRAYWARKIKVDRARPAADPGAAPARVEVCLNAARYLINAATTTFVEEFQDSDVVGDDRHRAALDGLRSSGVIVGGSGDDRLRFFHQTCAEFVMARYLLRDLAAREAFLATLGRAGADSHLWPVMTQLLYATGRDGDSAGFSELLDRLDPQVLRGWHAAVTACLARGDSAAVRRLAATAKGLPATHQELFFAALATVDERLAPTSVEVAADLMSECATSVLNLASNTAGALLARIPSTERTRVLSRLLDVTAQVGGGLDAAQGENLGRHLLARLRRGDLDAGGLEVLRAAYRGVGHLGRIEIVRLHQGAGPVELAQLLGVALRRTMPAPKVSPARDQLVAAVVQVLGDPAAQTFLGWPGWREMMVRGYHRGWDDIQCAAVVALAGSADPDAAPRIGDLLPLLWDDDQRIRQRAVYVCGTLAEQRPVDVADALAELPVPRSRAIVEAARSLAKRLGDLPEPQARRLVHWLLAALDSEDPGESPAAEAPAVEQVLQGAANFARKETPLLASVLGRIERVPPGKRRDRVLAAVLNAPPREIPALAPALRAALVPGGSLELQARLAGLLAPVDEQAREEATRFMLGPDAAHARAAARRMAAAAAAWDWYDSAYLARLLTAPTDGVVESAVEVLAAGRERGEPLDPEVRAALRKALAATLSSPVCGQIVSMLRLDPATGGPSDAASLTETVDLMAARARELPSVRPGRGQQDLLASLVRGALALLADALRAGLDDGAVDRTRLLLRDLPLDQVRRSEEPVRTLCAALDLRVPGALESLAGVIGEFPVGAQLGLAQAVERKYGVSSALFRDLAARDGVNPQVVAYVVGRQN
jgi:hypothetical protein